METCNKMLTVDITETTLLKPPVSTCVHPASVLSNCMHSKS